MTFIDFKKHLLDAEITLPKFAQMIQVSDKNIQSYKQKGEVPNALAAVAKCIAVMNQNGIDYRTSISELNLVKKSKKGGFSKKTD
jgi:hypothetical protein